MKIKRFQAADVRQAIREVREVLGPDAVILSNTRVDGGIEIVAATDYDENQFKRNIPTPAERANLDQAPTVEINPIREPERAPAPPPQANIWSQEPTLIQMRKEISGLKDMLQNQLSDLTWKDMERQNPTQVQLLQRHLKMGVQVEIARDITRKIQGVDDLETAWRQSLGMLASQISIQQVQ